MKHFRINEFACPCCKRAEMSSSFLEKLDNLRDICNIPFVVNSAFRCKKHNDAIGGSPRSQHLLGLAADISCINWSATQRFLFAKEAFRIGFRGIGIYETFFHVDLREGSESLWYGEKKSNDT